MERRKQGGCRTGREACPNGESGFALLLVFLMAATIAITLYMEIPRVAFEAQRQKEQLLIERGEQYKRAIQLFVKQNNRYPGEIKDLENFNNKRYLRHRFIDPMTGKDEWRLIHVNPAGIYTDSVTMKQKGQGDQKQSASTAGQYVGEQAGIGQVVTPGQQGINPAMRRRPSEGGAAPPGMTAPGQPYPAQPLPGDTQVQTTGIAQNPAAAPAYPNMPGVQPGMAGVQPNPAGPAAYPYQPGATNPGAPNTVMINGQPYPNGPPPPAGVPYPGLVAGGQARPYPAGQPGLGGAVAGQPAGGQYVGGNQPYVGGSQPYVGGGSYVGSQPAGQATPYFGQQAGNPGVQAGGNQGQPNPGQGAYPYQGVPGQGVNPQFPGTPGTPSFPQPGFQGGSQSQNPAAQMIQRILTSPRPGGMPQQGGAMGQTIGGGLAGVASQAEGDSIMVYNDHTAYNEWEFIFDPTKVKPPANPNAGGAGTPAGQLGNMGGTNPASLGNNPQGGTFGQNPTGVGQNPQSPGFGQQQQQPDVRPGQR